MSSDCGAPPANARTASRTPPWTAAGAAAARPARQASRRCCRTRRPRVEGLVDAVGVGDQGLARREAQARRRERHGASNRPSMVPPSTGSGRGGAARSQPHGGSWPAQASDSSPVASCTRRRRPSRTCRPRSRGTARGSPRPGCAAGSRWRAAAASNSVFARAMNSAAGTPLPETSATRKKTWPSSRGGRRGRRRSGARVEQRRELVALGRRAGLARRQHVHLDALRDRELALELLLRRGRDLEIVDVAAQRVAHLGESGGQRSQLVLRPRPGSGLSRFEASPRAAPASSRSGAVSRRDSVTTTAASTSRPTRPSVACSRQPIDAGHQLLLGVEDAERPPRDADRLVDHAPGLPVDHGRREAVCAREHVPHQRLELGAALRRQLLEQRRVDLVRPAPESARIRPPATARAPGRSGPGAPRSRWPRGSAAARRPSRPRAGGGGALAGEDGHGVGDHRLAAHRVEVGLGPRGAAVAAGPLYHCGCV